MVRGPPPSLLRLPGVEVPHTPTLLAQQATPPGTVPARGTLTGPLPLLYPVEERRVFTPIALGELPTGNTTTNGQRNEGMVSEGQKMNGGTQTEEQKASNGGGQQQQTMKLAPGTANVDTSKQQTQAMASGVTNGGTSKQQVQVMASEVTNVGASK